MHMYICMTIISLVHILTEGKESLVNLLILFKGMCHRYWHAFTTHVNIIFFTMDDQWFYSLTVWIYNKVDKQVKQ